MFENRVFDRRVPTDWKHVEKYPMRRAAAAPPLPPFERILDVPRQYRDEYDQGSEGACVGYSQSWMMSILNRQLYDAYRLYAEAQGIDEWADTPPEGGTSLRAGFDILRTKGHWRVYAGKTRSPQLTNGIAANRWIKTVEEVRIAIAAGMPVNLGINWYRGFFEPEGKPRMDRAKNLGLLDYWIGHQSSWSWIAGGHAITCVGISDKREALALCNTWGDSWPFIVWLPYKAFERLMREDGEAGIVTDR
jgi:hypothetical protein